MSLPTVESELSQPQTPPTRRAILHLGLDQMKTVVKFLAAVKAGSVMIENDAGTLIWSPRVSESERRIVPPLNQPRQSRSG